jgi:hypothetical protein
MPKPKAKTVIKQWDPIEVSWLDAIGPSGQLTLHDAIAYKPVLRKTLGYCMIITKEYVAIAETDDRGSEEKEVCDSVTSIPMPWIKKITLLKYVR